MKKQHLLFPGPVGEIEAVLQIPDNYDRKKIAVVCHPHPLQGGNMNNKVVTTVAKTCNDLGIAALRFDYRGVGDSDGVYGDVVGECEDAVAVTTSLYRQFSDAELFMTGFSFGSYVAAYTATQFKTSSLISIAPPVERMPFTELRGIDCPWLVIQGEADEVVTPDAVYEWFDQLEADKELVKFPDTGHFFHGKLIMLQDTLEPRLKNIY